MNKNGIKIAGKLYKLLKILDERHRLYHHKN
jgi:hypothetical protein